ncbi:hypothetical protein F5Y16DRAFT_406672 [Xylariaceae sp. FL0255]|nr:hypothetical protein F5Y16DRAFT_406672 [Xylariaceae sp. FL0255]
MHFITRSAALLITMAGLGRLATPQIIASRPCGQIFNLREVEYSIEGYSGSAGPPTVIRDSADLQIGGCITNDSNKIHYHNDDHNIAKHGTWVILNGE